MDDVMKGALLATCQCKKTPVERSNAVVYDPWTHDWKYVVWEAKPNLLRALGSDRVAVLCTGGVRGCPTCLEPAKIATALDYTHLPGECHDLLRDIHRPSATLEVVKPPESTGTTGEDEAKEE